MVVVHEHHVVQLRPVELDAYFRCHDKMDGSVL